ncbi:MAG: S9 family peptidase [Acetobacteraceae bacterium]|nr:S9 family peptidase [Acetobacteraceae bacterium]
MTTRPEDFAMIGAASAPAFTRDGRTLLHLRGSGLSQIWALDLDSGAERQLTSEDEKIAFLRRSPVTDVVAYGFDRGGDERQQLVLLDCAQEHPKPRALTKNLHAIHSWGGWSPEGARIAYASNERDKSRFDVYVQEVESGEPRCVFEGDSIVTVCGFCSDGTALALLQDRGYGKMSLLVLDLASMEARSFPQPGGTNYQTVRWANEGRALLGVTDHGGSNHMRLCRLDPDSGSAAVIYEAPGRDVEGWAISSDGTRLATIENDRGYSVLRVGPIEGNRPVVEGVPLGVISDPAFSPSGDRLAFTASTPTTPPSLWIWESRSVRPVLSLAPLSPAVNFEAVDWSSFDGLRIPGWFAVPSSPSPAHGYPAVIWVHGGPIGQARPNFRPDLHMLLSQGFAVLMPNVRGSSGYGREFAESDDVERRLDSVADLAHAHHWLAAHSAIDAGRIGIMGQSYGGFMVMSAITDIPSFGRPP